eukprot:759928-Hanusia_phi.AAC.13
MESEGDAIFRRAQDLIKEDRAFEFLCALKPSCRLMQRYTRQKISYSKRQWWAYRREGALKKEKIMLEMLKRIGGGQESDKSPMPRPTNTTRIDYSKFDKLELSSDDEDNKPKREHVKVEKPPIELLEAIKKVDEAKSRGNAQDIKEAEMSAAKALENV